jgi:tetratricopeptide (TPR) repeat protein
MVQAGTSDSASKRLARDLLVSLGSAQSTVTDAPQLVDESPESKADFVFEVTQSGGPSGASTANILLLRGNDHQVLASADLGPETSGQNLRDQVTAKAALLLGCAVDAATLDGKKLPLLKDFVSTCDQFASYFSVSDVEIIVPRLRSIVTEAPAFRPAYERLLLSESVGFLVPDESAKDAPTTLRRHIEAARRIDPDMPEADVAEAALLPLTAYADRLKLLDQAVANGPDNPLPLVARSMELMRVGRMGDAVTDAEKASRLRPLLPPGRFAYVMALIYRGQPERAATELAAAQRVLPWARNLTEAQFRLNLRYGDANQALRLLHAYGTSRAHEAFLAARLDPSEVNVQRAIGASKEVFDRFGYASSYAEVLGAFGKQDELYRALLSLPANHPDPLLASVLFRPVTNGARQDPRFLQVAKRLGLLDYWRSTGKWPDFCFAPDLPYECKAEAAKLK